MQTESNKTDQPLQTRGVIAAWGAFLLLVCSPIEFTTASAQRVFSSSVAFACAGLVLLAWWPRRRSWRWLTTTFAVGGVCVSLLSIFYAPAA